MKTLFSILAFLVFQVSIAQAPLPVIDHRVEDTFIQLKERSAAHGKDYQAKLTEAGFTGIQIVDSLPNDKLAAYKRTGSQFHVLIAKVSLQDKVSLEWTLAHELGHGLKLKHTDPPLPDGTYPWSAEIMSGSGPIDPSHLVYQIMVHPNYAPGIWERYFTQL